MTSIDIPHVAREGYTSKNYKMVLVIVIILITIFTTMNKSCSKKNIYFPDDKITEQFNPINVEHLLSPVKCQYIVFTNLNKKVIPIRKIVIMLKNRRLVPISINKAIIKNLGKNGTQITFKLKKEELITKIIIDLNVFCPSRKNMQTTQVDIRNKNNKSLWKYNKPLTVDERYINLFIKSPHIIHSDHHQLLYKNSKCSQENILNTILQNNTWSHG